MVYEEIVTLIKSVCSTHGIPETALTQGDVYAGQREGGSGNSEMAKIWSAINDIKGGSRQAGGGQNNQNQRNGSQARRSRSRRGQAGGQTGGAAGAAGAAGGQGARQPGQALQNKLNATCAAYNLGEKGHELLIICTLLII